MDSPIYRFFRENTRPIYFVSPTPYNLLGIDEWVSSFRYVCYFDVFDGAHDQSSFHPTLVHASSRPSSRSTRTSQGTRT